MAKRSPFPPLTIIVAAQAMSLVIFVGVAFVVTQGREPDPGAETISQVLALVGVLPLALSSFLQRQLLRTSHQRLTNSGAGEGQWAQAFTTAIIAGTAMREATGIFGLVITILTGDLFWVAAYAAIALVGIGLSFPTPDRYDNWRRTGA